ncbi:helix-turn-helix transcriptional regulator [Streptomyces sp. NRRL F-5053]|uniref:helix-turn-helix transcriptional regulator n=1 Tax=Streptomyces sp. NRRL F-5053 TaxID=1463854 RepID=UPI0004CC031E|nr:helix-turn-helix transcriptional regulator [Streptomyces sp. NRRL F-5053]
MTTTPGAEQAGRRTELRDFLRSRRARLSPQDVGLPPTRRRRTPGLRREEVATLAGVGLTWYTWLEQGRPISVTAGILAAVGEALRLDGDELAHLYRLAGHVPPAPDADTGGTEPDVPGQVAALADEWAPNPAYVLDRYWRCVYANAPVELLLGKAAPLRSCLEGFERGPDAERVLPEWESMAPSLVAQFRADAARHPDDAEFARIVGRLSRRSESFARLWAEQEVRDSGLGEKVFQVPDGRLVFERTALQLGDRPDLRIVLLRPKPGTGTRERLARRAEARPG